MAIQANGEPSHWPLCVGGYPQFVREGHNEAYLPIWLKDEGYSTYYVGKLFNAHDVTNYNKPYAAGWDRSDFLLDPCASQQVLPYSFTDNFSND